MSRIRFFRVEKSASLINYLQHHLHITEEQAEFLVVFGAIYRNFQRVIDNVELNTGDILRCHTEPKRYRSQVDWARHVVCEEDDFLIIDKPAGLPCQPSLDNRIENVLYQLRQHTKYTLFITHRLDIGTQGLVLLAKSKDFQTEFNHKLENRQVTKIYEALTLGPTLKSRSYVHWMQPHARSPKILAATPVEKWKECQLEILASQSLSSATLSKVDVQTHRGINYYRLQLHTGRTHQIRAQLSFETNPILGDTLYGGQEHQRPFEWQALQCSELGFQHAEKSFHWQIPSLRAFSEHPPTTETLGAESHAQKPREGTSLVI